MVLSEVAYKECKMRQNFIIFFYVLGLNPGIKHTGQTSTTELYIPIAPPCLVLSSHVHWHSQIWEQSFQTSFCLLLQQHCNPFRES